MEFNMSNNYNQVVDMLRACANYISENAQNMIGDTVNRCLSITVTIELGPDLCPTVNLSREYCPDIGGSYE